MELRLESLGGGKRAESLRVDIVQGERTLLASTTWMVDEGLRGYEHDVGAPPDLLVESFLWVV